MLAHHSNPQEEAKLAAMQRVWGRRGVSSTSIFEDVEETEAILSLPRPVS